MRLVLGLLLLSLSIAGRAEPQPLPDASLLDRDGARVALRQLSAAEQWAIVYVAVGCMPCERLLASLDAGFDEAAAPRVAILVSGEPAAARAWLGRFAKLAAGNWYVDVGGAAGQAMRVPGAPTLLGVRRDEVAWSVAGLIKDRATTRSTIVNWVGGR